MKDIARSKYFFNRCNPEVPVPENDPEGLYVDFDNDGLRGERCIQTLKENIEFADQPTTQLFTGFPGSGKTSELLRLVKGLSDKGYFVVFCDALETIDPLNPVAYLDVLVTLCLATEKAFFEIGEKTKIGAWVSRFSREIGEFLYADVIMKEAKVKLGKAPLGADFGIEMKMTPSFRNAARQAANNRRGALLDQVRNFFAKANDHIRENGYPNGLVLILDNLEKLSMEPDTRDSGRDMFLHHADALKTPGVHTIYTIPASYVFSQWGLQLARNFYAEPMVLPMVKITHPQTGNRFEKGYQAMRSLLLKRLDFGEVFGNDEGVVDALIENSGGYTRDLLRLSQYALQSSPQLPVGNQDVIKAIRKIEKSYRRSFRTTAIDLLDFVNQRPGSIPEEFRDRLELAMVNHYVMIFGNDSDWYDLHPIMRRILESVKTELSMYHQE